MERHRLDSFHGGWFVGDFDPAIVKLQAAEVGIKKYGAGQREPSHHHRRATELTAVVSGRIKMFDRQFSRGDIVEVSPGESTSFEAITDAVTVVVKLPSCPNDKYLD